MADETTTKALVTSKTIWLAVATIALGVIDQIQVLDWVNGNVITALGVVALVLRFFTNKAVTLK